MYFITFFDLVTFLLMFFSVQIYPNKYFFYFFFEQSLHILKLHLDNFFPQPNIVTMLMGLEVGLGCLALLSFLLFMACGYGYAYAGGGGSF